MADPNADLKAAERQARKSKGRFGRAARKAKRLNKRKVKALNSRKKKNK